jgi:hypothetical protein
MHVCVEASMKKETTTQHYDSCNNKKGEKCKAIVEQLEKGTDASLFLTANLWSPCQQGIRGLKRTWFSEEKN